MFHPYISLHKQYSNLEDTCYLLPSRLYSEFVGRSFYIFHKDPYACVSMYAMVWVAQI